MLAAGQRHRQIAEAGLPVFDDLAHLLDDRLAALRGMVAIDVLAGHVLTEGLGAGGPDQPETQPDVAIGTLHIDERDG